jgi:hypothetical protein
METHEIMTGPAVQPPWGMIAASCSYQRHCYNHPDPTQADQNVTCEPLRPLRRDAQVEEKQSRFRHGDRTHAEDRDYVHVLSKISAGC